MGEGMEVTPEEFKRLVDFEGLLVRTAIEARDAAEESALTYREIATRMGCESPSTVARICSGVDNITVDTLGRFALACGFKLEISIVKLKI